MEDAHIDMDEANANPDPYLMADVTGYPNVTKSAMTGVILEIRRERTVELCLEGFRLFHILGKIVITNRLFPRRTVRVVRTVNFYKIRRGKRTGCCRQHKPCNKQARSQFSFHNYFGENGDDYLYSPR